MFGNSFAALDGGQAEGEEVDVDWLSLKKPQHDVHVRVGSPLDLEATPAQSCLLAVHNELGIAAVGSANETRLHKLDSLATALESGSRDATPVSEPLLVISIPAPPLFVRIAQSKLVVSFGTSVVVWDMSGKMLHEFSAAADVDLLPNPCNSQVAAVSASTVTILDTDTFQVVSTFNGSFTSACWSVKGKQLVVGSGDLVQYTPAGEEKARVPRPSLDAAYVPTSILWLENDVFLATYTADDMSEVYVIERSKGQHSYTHFIDPLPPSGVYGRNGGPRHAVHVKKWASLRHLVVLSSPPSADIAVMGNIDGGWKVLNLEETSRASIPAVPDTYEETSCVGLQLDLRSKTPIKQPMEGGVEQPDLAPAPRVLAYTSEGIIVAYNIVIPSAEPYEGMVGASAPAASLALADKAPAFGSSAFGQPEPGSTPAFGAPAFGKAESSFSGFGKPSATPSAFGKPTFGSSTFGSPTASPSTTPAFGKSPFGASGAASGSSAFGAPSTPSSAFGASAFGTAPSSGFSGFGKKEASPSGFAGFGSKPTPPSSGFGAFAKKDTPNPFGASAFSPSASQSNPFAKSKATSPPSMGLDGFADALGSSKSALDDSPPTSPVLGQRGVPGLEDDTPPSSPIAPKATPASFIKPATAFGGPGPFSSPKPAFGSGSGHGAFASTPKPTAPAPSTTPKDKPTAFGQPAFGTSSTPAFGKPSAFGTSTFGAPVQAASPVASTGGFAGFSAAPKTGGFAGFGAPSGGFAAAAKSGESAFGSMLGKTDGSPVPSPKSLFSGSAFAPAPVKEDKEVEAVEKPVEAVVAPTTKETESPKTTTEAPTTPETPKAAQEAEKETGGYEEDEEQVQEDDAQSNASSVQVVQVEDAEAESADEPSEPVEPIPESTTPSTSPQDAPKELASTEEHTTESLESVPSDASDDADPEESAQEEDDAEEDTPGAHDDQDQVDTDDSETGESDAESEDRPKRAKSPPPFGFGKANKLAEPQPETPKETPKFNKPLFGKGFPSTAPSRSSPLASMPAWQASSTPPDSPEKSPASEEESKPSEAHKPTASPLSFAPKASGLGLGRPSSAPPTEPERPSIPTASSFAGFGAPKATEPKAFTGFGAAASAEPAKPSFTGFGAVKAADLAKPASSSFDKPVSSESPKSAFTGFGSSPAEPKPAFTGFGKPQEVAKASPNSDKSEPAKPAFGSFGKPASAEVSKPAFTGFGTPPAEAKPAFTGQQDVADTQSKAVKPAFTGFGKPQEAKAARAPAEPADKPSLTGFGKPQEAPQTSLFASVPPKTAPIVVEPTPAKPTAPVREESPYKPEPVADGKGLAGAFLQAYQLVQNDIASLSHTLKSRARYHNAVRGSTQPLDRNALGSFIPFSNLDNVSTIIDGLVSEASAAAEQTEEPRIKMAEVQSLLFKTEAKASQASKLHKAKTDPSYAKMMRVRQLGPEHTYNQLRLRKETAAVQSRIEQLETQIAALTRKAEQQHAPLRPPTLDTVNRTVRNIDTTLRQKQSEVDALTSKIKHLAVRKSAPTTPKASTPVKNRLMTPSKVSLRAVETEATMKSLGASMRAEKRQALLTEVASKPTFQPAFLAGPVPLGSARVTAVQARETPAPSGFAGITLGPMDPGSFHSSGRRNTREPTKRSPAAHLSHPATSTTKPATPFFFAPK